jgi:hypothetical protein
MTPMEEWVAGRLWVNRPRKKIVTREYVENGIGYRINFESNEEVEVIRKPTCKELTLTPTGRFSTLYGKFIASSPMASIRRIFQRLVRKFSK